MSKNLRTYLDDLRERRPEDLKVCDREVDPVFEITALLQRLQNRGEFPAVLFRNVKGARVNGHRMPVLINTHASWDRMALAVGAADTRELERTYAERESHPSPVRWVERDQAPVKELVLRDEDVDLTALPLTHKNEKDAGRYISCGVSILRERSTGRLNCGIYRHQLQGERQLGFMVNPGNHGSHVQREYEDHGEPTPIAIVIGHHPCFYLAAVSKLPAPGMELEVAGSLLGEPLEVVRGETVDLPIPAQAEIVIEGYLPPGERQWEGTFGEWPGYYNMEGPRPVIRVTAVNMRRDAICQDLFNAHPEHTILGAVPRMGSLTRAIRGVCPNVTAVSLPWSGGCRSVCYISLRKRAEGEPKQAAFAAFTTDNNIKHVLVVDDDIDVFNETEVLWAMAMRFEADRDMAVIPNALGAHLNPSAYGHNRLDKGVMETKVIFDCTRPLPPVPFAERVSVPADVVERMDPDVYLEDWRTVAAGAAGSA